jgi:hypothetical protein|nr:MAG TPA: hypothetical protein [Caudoviricetes sp.]
MFEKLIAVVSIEEKPVPEETTPTTTELEPQTEPATEDQSLPEPTTESQAHIDWRQKKEQFIQQFCHGEEPTGGLAEIMAASIGAEPEFYA